MILPTLARLSFVRCLAPAVVLAWLALLSWTLATSGIAAGAYLDGGSAAEAGELRANAWTLAALAGFLVCGLQAARTLPGWRRRDVDWMAPRAIPASALLGWSWCGIVAAGLSLAATAGVAAELCAPADRGSWREGAPGLAASEGWLGGERASELELSPAAVDRPAGSRLRLAFAFAGGGPEAEVEAWIAVAGGEPPLGRVRRAITARGTLELELPPACPGERLHLRLATPGARLFHEAESARLWLPVEHGRAASATMLGWLALDAAAWSALALGLGGWLSSASASFALLVLAALAVLGGFGAGGWPSAGLAHALAVLQEGRVPAGPGSEHLAGAAALGAAGWALARASLVRWSRER